MPTATRAPAPPRTTRMTLVRDEFIADIRPYRFSAGTVVLVDEETADRWREKGIAVDSAETDKTAAELKRLELERLQREIAALESGDAVGNLGIAASAAGDIVRKRQR